MRVTINPESGQHPLLQLLLAARNHEASILAGDDEAVHQYRVNLRQLRALIGLLARLQPALRLDPIGKGIKQLMRATADDRDRAVALSLLRQRHAPAELAGLATTSCDRARLGQWLTSSDYQHQCEQLQALLALLPPLPARHRWAKGCARNGRKLSRACRQLRTDSAPTELHQLRIAIKKLRYRLELLGKAPKSAQATLAELRQWQKLLGELHDQAVVVALLLNSDGSSVGQPLLLQELQRLEQQRQQAITSLKASSLAKADGKRWRRRLRRWSP
ncbi:MAG: CHAD domain-containing protein [Gammaproteobacteria bacterium]|nr:CHAD domain-containing protein [Gammaproteobacteria bacterium]